MMKRAVFTLTFCLGTLPAWALQETHCSNADGSFRRQEKENWGANEASYYLDGEEFKLHTDLSETFSQENILEISKLRDLYKTQIKVFSARIKLEALEDKNLGFHPKDPEQPLRVREDYVICRSWSNDALD